MIIVQATPGKPFYTQRQTLDGKDYVLTFEWNMRSGWYLGLADQSGGVICAPRKLCLSNDHLGSLRSDPRTPPGVLAALAVDGSGVEPGYDDLATGTSLDALTGRVALTYTSVDELFP